MANSQIDEAMLVQPVNKVKRNILHVGYKTIALKAAVKA
jgi:hypothetical protein